MFKQREFGTNLLTGSRVFPQASRSENLSHDVVQTAAGSFCVEASEECPPDAGSAAMGLSSWQIPPGTRGQQGCVCAHARTRWSEMNGFRVGQQAGQAALFIYRTCMSHGTTVNLTATCQLKTSPCSQPLTLFIAALQIASCYYCLPALLLTSTFLNTVSCNHCIWHTELAYLSWLNIAKQAVSVKWHKIFAKLKSFMNIHYFDLRAQKCVHCAPRPCGVISNISVTVLSDAFSP